MCTLDFVKKKKYVFIYYFAKKAVWMYLFNSVGFFPPFLVPVPKHPFTCFILPVEEL